MLAVLATFGVYDCAVCAALKMSACLYDYIRISAPNTFQGWEKFFNIFFLRKLQ